MDLNSPLESSCKAPSLPDNEEALSVPTLPPFPLPLPIFVLSDLHLGHPASHLSEPELLFPVLEAAGSVVINGDSYEALNVRRREAATLKNRRLLDFLRNRRTPCIQITGNHDPEVSDFHHLDLLDGRIFVTHGDALHPDVAPWSREAKALRTERLRIETAEPERALDRQTLDGRLRLAKRCALVVGSEDRHGNRRLMARFLMTGQFAMQPWRAARAVRYWASVPNLASAMRDQFRPAAKLMLIGHSHRPGIWRREGWTLVNTGSFQPLSSPLLAVLGLDRAVIHRLKRRQSGYSVAAPVAEIALAPTDLSTLDRT